MLSVKLHDLAAVVFNISAKENKKSEKNLGLNSYRFSLFTFRYSLFTFRFLLIVSALPIQACGQYKHLNQDGRPTLEKHHLSETHGHHQQYQQALEKHH